MCDLLWGAAFHYSEDLNNCVLWDFGLTTGNPNKYVEKQLYGSFLLFYLFYFIYLLSNKTTTFLSLTYSWILLQYNLYWITPSSPKKDKTKSSMFTWERTWNTFSSGCSLSLSFFFLKTKILKIFNTIFSFFIVKFEKLSPIFRNVLLWKNNWFFVCFCFL